MVEPQGICEIMRCWPIADQLNRWWAKALMRCGYFLERTGIVNTFKVLLQLCLLNKREIDYVVLQ